MRRPLPTLVPRACDASHVNPLSSSSYVTLPVGTAFGPFEVLALIGVGGMGEVYRARDPRLQRDIALKVLPANVAFDAARLARFKREAQLLAALNHPNIAAIFGVEESNGVQGLVLELVDGPTLDDDLRKGALPPADAIAIARQIADALEAAHEAGIIHRDLKPSNVKLRPDGTVKVLDFGLAKAVDADASGFTTSAPTITSPAMTQHGVILGTAAYMSPEQAKGRPADKRSDVWALGVVLFEMLTGRRPFRGDDVADTIAAVLRAEPVWSELPPQTPPGLIRVARRCLQKDPRRRWQHMGDLRLELVEGEGSAADSLPATVHAARSTLGISGIVALAIVSAAIGAGVSRWLSTPDTPAVLPPVGFALPLAMGERHAGNERSFGVSPDGRHIAYGVLKDGRRQLVLRTLDRPDSVPIGGTENGTYPVFSPDSTAIAFIADGWLKRVPISGGTATTITPVTAPRGLAWGPDDRIVFAANASSGLSMVSASGGAPEPLTELDTAKGEINHRWPVVLPDGSGVLFAVQRRSRTELDLEGVWFQSRKRTAVRTDAFPVQVLQTNHLIYSAVNGDTFLAPFDVSRMTLTGPPTPIPERPGYNEVPGFTSVALSPTGTMVSMPWREPLRTLVVVGRDGQQRTLAAPPRNYQQVVISPDGQRIATVVKTGLSEWDIWAMDTAADAPLRRLTVSRFNTWPLWEPDNATLIYSAFEEGRWQLLSRNVDLNESPRELWSEMEQEPRVLGRVPGGDLAFTLILPQQTLYALLKGERSVAKTTPETGRFNRSLSRFSADDRWMAYASTQSGQRETYVTHSSAAVSHARCRDEVGNRRSGARQDRNCSTIRHRRTVPPRSSPSK
jgi:eukaryotic-like serine/threonine-protein kinase